MSIDDLTATTPAPTLAPAPAARAVPPPEAWAVRAARLAVACVLPSSLWRVALALGVPLGFSAGVLREELHSPGWGTAYMLGLSLLSEALAFLTLGLVRPWGEVMPRWIPVLGGRRVVPRAAVTAAATGAVLLTLLFTLLPVVQILFVHIEHDLHGRWLWLMRACYLPLIAWGPLLAAVTVSYHRRHRPPQLPATAVPPVCPVGP
ncbi:hypothetical protein AB0L26_15680 [Streptomyces nondiastaticus]|uniref:hypothetical protein n=1 Tax=Streptomyces nondiastaticus TaxID=3154512 RepID=UPI003428122A